LKRTTSSDRSKGFAAPQKRAYSFVKLIPDHNPCFESVAQSRPAPSPVRTSRPRPAGNFRRDHAKIQVPGEPARLRSHDPPHGRPHASGKDTDDLYSALLLGKIPAVSFVKPSGLNDGHPASSKLDIFEAFVQKIIDLVHANPKLYRDTAILITTDEAGGYYDTGYTHPLDFFGDGNRIPLIVVSRYSEGVGVVHDYTDHVSILKFVEKNWSLPPISNRSRDNLPNPTYANIDPYVPTNGAAIGDLMDFFNFKK
jgi:phospholipase C